MVERRVEAVLPEAPGRWSARLSCLHTLSTLHTLSAAEAPTGTSAPSVGAVVDCDRCERAELPAGLQRVRSTDLFDEQTVPAGLLRRHRVADGVWGVLSVQEGSLGFHLDTEPPRDVVLRAGDRQPIPPTVTHEVRLVGPVRFRVEFWTS